MGQGSPTPQRPRIPVAHGRTAHKGPERGHGLFYYLILLCFFGSFIPYLITTALTCSAVKGSFRREVFNHLISVRDIKRGQLEHYFLDRKADTYALATSPLIVRAAASFINGFKQGGLEGNLYKEADINYGRMLEDFCNAHEYYDIFVVDMEGNIVVSARDFPVQGKNIPKNYPDSPLSETFKRGMEGINIGDMRWYEPYRGPAIFVSAPLVLRRAEERTMVGVIIAHINPIKINEIMAQRSGLGETGETYVVGQDFLMRSDSRFFQDSTMLRKSVDTVAVRESLANQPNCKVINDYREQKVLSAYVPVEITEGIRWALIAEIDVREALNLEDTISGRVIYLTLAIIPFWGVILFIFYRLIRAWHRQEMVHIAAHPHATGHPPIPGPHSIVDPHTTPPHGPKA